MKDGIRQYRYVYSNNMQVFSVKEWDVDAVAMGIESE